MENEYSKLYNYFYNKTECKAEQLLKNLFLFHKNKNKTYSYFYNPTLLKIEEKSREMFYINSSKKFNSVIEIFKSSEFDNLVFQEEMFEAFKTIEDIEDNYNYKKFISELGQINALKEVGRKFRKFEVIYKFMFQLNDFSEFKLWDYDVDVETHPIFKKFHKKIYPNNDKNEKEKKSYKNIKNFMFKKKYEDKLMSLHQYLIEKAIIDIKTPFEVFELVFTKDWQPDKNKITFNSTQEISLIISKIGFAFENFNDVSVGESMSFSSNRGNPLYRDNIVSSRKVFNKSDKLTLDEMPKIFNKKQIRALKNANEIVKILKK